MGEAHFVKDTVKVSWTPREGVINDYTFRYMFNFWNEDFGTAQYVNKDGRSTPWIASTSQTRCSMAYTEMGNKVQKATFEFFWCYDHDFMGDLIDAITRWNFKRRMKIKGRLLLDNIGLELADIVALDLPDLLDSSDWQENRFIVEGTAIYKNKGYMDVYLLQVH